MFKNSGLFKSGDGDAKAGVAAENSEGVRGEAPQMPLDSTVNANDDASSIEGTVDSASAISSLSKEELAKVQALRSKMISASFGEIVTLLMRSPHYKHYSLSDLEWLVIPALLTNQFLVVEAQMKLPVPQNENGDAPVAGGQTEGAPVAGPRIPVGLALWAKVSPEVDEKLSANLDTPVKLRPDEWRSGEINWIIDVLGDEKIMQSLYAKLKGDVFKGQTFKVRAQDKKGQRVVTEVTGGEKTNSAV